MVQYEKTMWMPNKQRVVTSDNVQRTMKVVHGDKRSLLFNVGLQTSAKQISDMPAWVTRGVARQLVRQPTQTTEVTWRSAYGKRWRYSAGSRKQNAVWSKSVQNFGPRDEIPECSMTNRDGSSRTSVDSCSCGRSVGHYHRRRKLGAAFGSGNKTESIKYRYQTILWRHLLPGSHAVRLMQLELMPNGSAIRPKQFAVTLQKLTVRTGCVPQRSAAEADLSLRMSSCRYPHPRCHAVIPPGTQHRRDAPVSLTSCRCLRNVWEHFISCQVTKSTRQWRCDSANTHSSSLLGSWCYYKSGGSVCVCVWTAQAVTLRSKCVKARNKIQEN
jgi:hypothetical protein